MVWPVYGVYIVAVIFIIGGSQSTQRKPLTCRKSLTVLDLPLCLGVLKHWASLARGGAHLPAKNFFTMDFGLCGAILNLKALCFGAIHDIMIELIAYWSVPKSRQS
jgi:hypothetical protein